MADGDLKEHALNSTVDFYELLGISSAANESEIRRAYRKTALKYHPDKVGPDPVAAEKFHILQVAYDVLSDDTVRQLYDNARRAREEKKEREAAYEGRRRNLKEELERREKAGVAGLKRKREEAQEEEAFQRELKRLAADGARRRKEREEQLRQELQEEREHEQRNNDNTDSRPATPNVGVEEIDRTIKFRYPAETVNLDQDQLKQRFSRFGKIQDVVLRNKKIKAEGEKHRRDYTVAIVVFESIVGAHAAIADIPRLSKQDGFDSTWAMFENLTWASGKEPDCIPKRRETPVSKPDSVQPDHLDSDSPAKPSTPAVDRIKSMGREAHGGAGLKKVPSFGSFKGTPKASSTPAGKGSPSGEELMMIRLKNAERKRLADKLKKEDEEAQADEVAV